MQMQIQKKKQNQMQKQMHKWAADVNHYTQRVMVNIIFPREKPTLRLLIVESNRQKTQESPRELITQLPDKRRQVTWEKRNPGLYEHYVLKWEW